MKLGEPQQPFASPEEALKHYGVKGMRWGVRKQEETSGRDHARKEPPAPHDAARRNEEMKRSIAETIATGNATPPVTKTSSGHVSQIEKQDHQGIGGLSPNEKKALIATGVVAVGVVGFVAYKHYAGGNLQNLKVPEDFDVSKLSDRPLSKVGLGKLDHGHSLYTLDDPEKLMVNLSHGYADIRPIDGFGNEAVARRHAELIKTFEEMRERYPSVRNLNVEVVPMSYVPGMERMTAEKCPAAVMAIKKGEARILYNDLMGELSPTEADYIKKWQPGVFTKDFLGNHEMGHILAVANGNIPPSFDVFSQPTVRGQLRWSKFMAESHKGLMKKHGLSYKELSKLSKYAATQPAEALAELSGHYFTPEYRAKMDPDLLKKAEALFNDMGGVT